MSNKKITDLTELTTPTTDDVFPVVDIATNTTKKVQLGNLPVPSSVTTALATKQDSLVSGTNIKTINSTTLLGSGDLAVQPTLVSGTNIKTVNSTSLLGSGDVAVQATLVSGTNIKTINSTSLLGSGNITIAANPSGVSGAIQFSNGSAFASDASNLFWDDTNNRLGVGTNTPTATTHIKGSGSTSATTSLLVQNSSATQLFNITDDGKATIGTNSGNSGALLFQYPGGGNGVFFGDSYSIIYGSLTLNRSSGEFRMFGSNGGYFPTFYSHGVERMRIDISGNVGIGTATPTSRLHITGSGSTSATTSLLVQNSSGTAALTIKDDLSTTFLGTLFGVNGVFNANINFQNILYGTNFWSQNDGGTTIGAQAAPVASAILDIRSTTKGFLPPRMTTTQKNAISSPAAGLVVYDSTTNKLCCYNGSSWNDLF